MGNHTISQKEIKLIPMGYNLEDDEQDKIVDDINQLLSKSYDEGFVNGAIEYEDEHPPQNEEKIGCDFVVDKFSDCRTLSDFENKLKEITLRSYNFQ